MNYFRVFSSATAISLLMSGVASAAIFPDVPDGHIFQQPIENLVGSSVLNGNPDGQFYPNNAVNRAELLKMLYKAAGKTPDPSSVKCFPDVEPGSWYEMFVCDAAANSYVNGYPDGTFQPGKFVNRVEALKMIMNILGISVDEIDIGAREAVKFVDVSVSAWYTKYLYTAYTTNILPIAGMDGSRFYPESPLTRGEAAAMVYNAIVVELNAGRSTSSSSSASSVESSSTSTDTSTSTASESSTSSTANTGPTDTTVSTSFPFDTSGKFDDKQSYSYTFSTTQTTTGFIEVEAQTGAVTCRLYLLKESGFADEYYLGHQEGSRCYLHTTMRAGDYQLQLQPTVADATFTVETTEKAGDGNDGYIQASRLLKGNPKTSELAINDIADYYIFTISSEQSHTLEITNALEINCVIFPMDDVDLFGFSSPECNKSYSYPPGTYYVAINRSIASKTSKKTYTLTLR